MTPAADDQLAAVLEEIAEMERREGFGGPKISPQLSYLSFVLEQWGEIEFDGLNSAEEPADNPEIPDEWIEDITVGEIRRASRRGNPDDGMEIEFEARINGMFSATITVWRWGVMQKVIRRFGDSLTLAAAMAYRDALKETIK